jgi:FtsP/CotA-like multicopper oxidase with cupredoxin domain
MKRRRFLQLAATAAATAVIRRSSALSCSAGHISQPAAADVLSLTVGEPSLVAINALQARFAANRRPAVEPDQMIEMLLEQRSDRIYQWTIDGRRDLTEALFLKQGRRYRLRMMNATGGVHAVHLQNHSFELRRIHQIPVSGIFKNTLCLGRYNVVEADVLMTRSGPLVLRYPSS